MLNYQRVYLLASSELCILPDIMFTRPLPILRINQLENKRRTCKINDEKTHKKNKSEQSIKEKRKIKDGKQWENTRTKKKQWSCTAAFSCIYFFSGKHNNAK